MNSPVYPLTICPANVYEACCIEPGGGLALSAVDQTGTRVARVIVRTRAEYEAAYDRLRALIAPPALTLLP